MVQCDGAPGCISGGRSVLQKGSAAWASCIGAPPDSLVGEGLSGALHKMNHFGMHIINNKNKNPKRGNKVFELICSSPFPLF